MVKGGKDHVGTRLRALREEFNLSQEEWGKLLQVTSNTVARWERGELEPKGAHRKKVEQVLAISEDDRAKETIKATLASEGGLPATAAFLGMLFGVLGVLGVGLGLAAPLLRSKTNLLSGIMSYVKKEENNTPSK
ncbi:helix-turn-helix domain-containing protein [Desulfonatronum thiodismutans]|jgi:transcriptional regulator with XRE-family HTH domain|uniref:helix-turn-helix domain-containing protein n=1 Tax=Desulfonatronum thiodismutans TaxID=159290 RepID=UPI000A07AA44|nr:helix-turn-helix transcriptional regulator [Desulfonatronum thiodismutans]